jgi:hypothetical protein
MWGPVLIVFLIVLSDLLARTYDVAARHWLSDLKAHWRGPTAPHFPEK